MNKMKQEDPISINLATEYKHLLKKHAENMLAKEYSKDALDVITSIIYHNPSNYSIWVDRRAILRNLPDSAYTLEDELVWIKKQAVENQKNYQVWHHFKFVLKSTGHEISTDLDILEIAKKEPKNIHFWGAFIQCYRDRKSALEYTGYFIEEDVRNNSAYSIRYTVVMEMAKNREIEMEEEKAFLLRLPILKQNPAYWNYAGALDRAYPEHQILKSCELALQSKEVPKYYED
ncbi:protein farnesyltransferase/geranylgeranyltransferase type-1 subunit alpha [Nematocida minor]|uniref:protein farnesyltransferase/geranylgeranyltransferase type-1 subunit alpha n=1 Tax=Nematocida minor TaxID=1912983 RepID=UPI00221E66A8|nr:protein farnesyltransferase/geranylgeranyltransferase type-1 subunit alpha [Nematocida minor]KAI5189382.1 protein farnesyltransferase/geranylgeranyltransferase type-1 subunit alpha [Nematocida minor]